MANVGFRLRASCLFCSPAWSCLFMSVSGTYRNIGCLVSKTSRNTDNQAANTGRDLGKKSRTPENVLSRRKICIAYARAEGSSPSNPDVQSVPNTPTATIHTKAMLHALQSRACLWRFDKARRPIEDVSVRSMGPHKNLIHTFSASRDPHSRTQRDGKSLKPPNNSSYYYETWALPGATTKEASSKAGILTRIGFTDCRAFLQHLDGCQMDLMYPTTCNGHGNRCYETKRTGRKATKPLSKAKVSPLGQGMPVCSTMLPPLLRLIRPDHPRMFPQSKVLIVLIVGNAVYMQPARTMKQSPRAAHQLLLLPDLRVARLADPLLLLVPSCSVSWLPPVDTHPISCLGCVATNIKPERPNVLLGLEAD